MYQKAEVLYAQGEFEQALVFYHRGNKLRPEIQDFRKGIQKAEEAIDNSVGDPGKVHLTREGDLSYFEDQRIKVGFLAILTLKVLVATIDAQWEGMGDVGSARYEPALLPPCPTIRVLSYSS